MTCSDWQFRIASESEDPALAEHLNDCEACREFARDLAENAAALRSIAVDPKAYTAVRARVLASVRPRRRFAWLWAASAAAAACAVVVWFAILLPSPAPPNIAHIAPPGEASAPLRPPLGMGDPWQAAKTRVIVPRPLASGSHRRTRPGSLIAQAPAQESLTAIKLLTDDPNVVIIWLVEKKGDSL